MLTDNEKELKRRLMNLDTAAISDALDSFSITGGLLDIIPRTQGKKMAGPVFTVQYSPIESTSGKFSNAGNYIDEVSPGHVILVDNQGRQDCTSWGGILTTKANLKQIEGTVVHGSGRDIAEIQAKDYPFFSTSIFMVSGKNRAVVTAKQIALNVNGVVVSPGDWLFGDDNGVISIPADKLEIVISRAENTELTEKHILDAINKGEDLEVARSKYKYATPWEKQGK